MKKITFVKHLSFFIALFCAVNFGFGQTTLAAGDIAITGVNSDNPDQFTFVLTKDQGVVSFKNQQQQGEIAGEPFRQALIKIWLGDEPAQKSLKKAMLGN